MIYNLHLESRTTEHGRLQLEEEPANTQRYPAGTPVIISAELLFYTIANLSDHAIFQHG